MRVKATGGVLALCLLSLTGCTGSMTHQDAWPATFGGIIGTALLLGMAKVFWASDGGMRIPAAASGIFAIGLLIWAVNGFVSLLGPNPAPATAGFQCTVTADRHTLVTIQNRGSTVLQIGQVQVQFQDATGKTLGDPAMAFLPAVMKMPQHFGPGETRQFDLGDLAPTAATKPAQCKVTGSSIKGGPGRGSVLSAW